jgi:hypothetical protein
MEGKEDTQPKIRCSSMSGSARSGTEVETIMKACRAREVTSPWC